MQLTYESVESNGTYHLIASLGKFCSLAEFTTVPSPETLLDSSRALTAQLCAKWEAEARRAAREVLQCVRFFGMSVRFNQRGLR